jgi:rubrerythrin
MSKTNENLMAAFAGESQANRKYLAFAAQAEKDGYPRAARMFRAAAMAETCHALSHFRAAGGVGATADNLKAAVAGETYEFTDMYPPMIEQAKADGNEKAVKSFEYAQAAEKVHARLYQDVLDKLKAGEDTDFHVCKICGNVVEGSAPDTCDICGAGAKAFEKVA